MIVLSLFYTDLEPITCQSTAKLTRRLAQELTQPPGQPPHNGTTLAYENHYHIFLRPTTIEIFFIAIFFIITKESGQNKTTRAI